MGRCCAVCGRRPSKTVHMHTFPRHDKKRLAWLESLNMLGEANVIKYRHSICHLHFAKKCYATPDRLKLNRNAVPTLLPQETAMICGKETVVLHSNDDAEEGVGDDIRPGPEVASEVEIESSAALLTALPDDTESDDDSDSEHDEESEFRDIINNYLTPMTNVENVMKSRDPYPPNYHRTEIKYEHDDDIDISEMSMSPVHEEELNVENITINLRHEKEQSSDEQSVQSETEDDETFFQSLLPAVAKIVGVKKLEFRKKLEKLVNEYANK